MLYWIQLIIEENHSTFCKRSYKIWLYKKPDLTFPVVPAGWNIIWIMESKCDYITKQDGVKENIKCNKNNIIFIVLHRVFWTKNQRVHTWQYILLEVLIHYDHPLLALVDYLQLYHHQFLSKYLHLPWMMQIWKLKHKIIEGNKKADGFKKDSIFSSLFNKKF